MSRGDKNRKLLERGIALHRGGDVQQADRLYTELLAREPKNGDAWFLRSLIAMEGGDAAGAASLLERAVECRPQHAPFHNNLGDAYLKLGRLEDASRSLQRAIAIDPACASAHANLGFVHRARGELPDAVRCFRAALALQLQLKGIVSALLDALRESEQPEQAVQVYEALVACVPESASLCRAAGLAYKDVQRLDEAVSLLRRARALAPESADACLACAGALFHRGESEEAIELYREAVALDPSNHFTKSSLLFAMMHASSCDAASMRREAENYQREHLAALPRYREHANDRESERRLRIGYVSSDFRLSSIALFISPLLHHHDRSEVEVFCYANASQTDEVTAKLAASVQGFCSIARLDDDAAAERIRADEIDILVDLNMHTRGHRLLLFARKPAPIQVCWLAYAGTTGVDAIDYRISDVHLDPPGAPDDVYTERTVRLPETFWCYDPLTSEPPVSALPALERGHVTFGSLNFTRKLTDASLELWALALGRVPDSRLLLFAPEGEARARIRRILAQSGVGPERVDFVGYAPRCEYLEAYRRIDCCLDPVPCNGGTTSFDAFWMGVPVLTLHGSSAMGRAGASIARNLGLEELVAHTREEFADRAERLCSDLGMLAQLRADLRTRVERSPLMDGPRFARALEGSYRSMWRTFCAVHEHTSGAVGGSS